MLTDSRICKRQVEHSGEAGGSMAFKARVGIKNIGPVAGANIDILSTKTIYLPGTLNESPLVHA